MVLSWVPFGSQFCAIELPAGNTDIQPSQKWNRYTPDTEKVARRRIQLYKPAGKRSTPPYLTDILTADLSVISAIYNRYSNQAR
jgi:hypothetical protein